MKDKKRLIYIFKIYKLMFAKYKPQIAVLAILAFLSGFLEGIGIGIIIPLFAFLIDKGALGTDIITRFISGIFGFLGMELKLAPLLVFMFFLFVFKAIATLVFGYIRTRIIIDYTHDLKTDLYRKTFSASWPYLLKQKAGYLNVTMTSDVRAYESMLSAITSLILVITGLVIYITIAISISFFITVTAIISGAFILYLFKPLLFKSKRYAKILADLYKATVHEVQQNLSGIKIIKAMALEMAVARSVYPLFELWRKTSIRSTIIKSISSATMMQPFILLFIIFIFAISYSRPGFQLASFVAIIYLSQRIFGFFGDLQHSLQQIGMAIPSVQNVISLAEEIKKHSERDFGTREFNFERELEFRDIYFSYISGRPIFEGLTFAIKKGESLGIIGASGAGKTTLVDLCLRLLEPNKGAIIVDGVPADEISLGDWRKAIGYVSQDIFIKNETIENNIRFHDYNISERNIIEAAKKANIYDFVMNLPDKFQTTVGDRGVMLSGGERQRVQLARVFARSPSILILDEATSALDNESEKAVQDALESVKSQYTMIIIAHRLSTVMNCDRLIVLGGGKIMESGKPADLLKDQDSYFYKTYNLR